MEFCEIRMSLTSCKTLPETENWKQKTGNRKLETEN